MENRHMTEASLKDLMDFLIADTDRFRLVFVPQLCYISIL